MLRGVDIDDAGRCAHHRDPHDVVCYAFPCCDGSWACRACHDELQDHEATPWPADRHAALAVQCGACRSRIQIQYYLDRNAEQCPHCHHAWNPGCRDHEDRYFERA